MVLQIQGWPPKHNLQWSHVDIARWNTHTHLYIYIYVYNIIYIYSGNMIHHRYLNVFDNWNIYIYVYIMVHHGLGPHGEQQSQFVNHLVCEHKPYIMGIWSTLGIWSCAFISKIYVPKSFICNDSDESCSHSSQIGPLMQEPDSLIHPTEIQIE